MTANVYRKKMSHKVFIYTHFKLGRSFIHHDLILCKKIFRTFYEIVYIVRCVQKVKVTKTFIYSTCSTITKSYTFTVSTSNIRFSDPFNRRDVIIKTSEVKDFHIQMRECAKIKSTLFITFNQTVKNVLMT